MTCRAPGRLCLTVLLKLEEEVYLVCNPGGRAVATLSDLPDAVVAEELRTVLDTAAV